MSSYGIIGYPLTHSFSEKYFTEKIAREGITDAVFHNFPLTNIEAFPELLLSNPSLRGLAVTIPYKEKVLAYVQHLSDEVQQIGAANCIKIREGVLTAFNTDIIGFERSFVKHLQPHHTKALILGTGGASKAIQFVLKKLGIEFLIVSRNSNEDHIAYTEIDDNILHDHRVIINCTPLGTFPHTNTFPEIPYHLLNPEHYLYDLVYNPAKTLFLQKGEEQGTIIENGMDMLIIQAEENWRIWNEV